MRLTFIVGSGRCGSTMLSDALRSHPQVLSLSEFFACLSPSAFPTTSVDGAEFWRILATPRLKPNTLIRHGIPADEFIYPGRGRFRPGSIPAISLVTLPHLAADPDRLYDELAEVVPRWPADQPAAQYRRLFQWLLRRLGKAVVVERSGGSLRFVTSLRRFFPGARFLHLRRGGPATALSMSRHPSFRLAAVLSEIIRYTGADPYHEPSDRYAAALPPDLRAFLPDQFSADALRERDIPLARFGHLWSRQIVEGVAALAAVPPSCQASMSYEAVLTAPERELTELARFVGADLDEAWLKEAAAGVDPARSRGDRGLPEPARTELIRACAPGTRLVRDANS
jgi:putative sulfotransferase